MTTSTTSFDKCQVVLLCILLAATILQGCGPTGPDLGPMGLVSGKVTRENSPITNATITFTNPKSGQVASANLQEDGTYTMSLAGRNDGMPVGKYLVYLLPDLAKLKEGETDYSRDRSPYNPDIAPEIAMKYRDETASGLVADVVEGENVFDYELTGRN